MADTPPTSSCEHVRGLFAPLSCQHFVATYWERRHHLVRSAGVDRVAATPLGFGRMLCSDDVFRMSAHWEFKVGKDHSQARMLRPNSFAHNTDWVDGSRVDKAVMLAAHRSNHTVVMHNVELYWRPIAQLSLALHRHFGLYAQANVYFSPPGLAAATHAHQDAQSVFVLQCEGLKRWELFKPPQRWRLRNNQRGKAGDVAPISELREPVEDVTLAPGDVLFVPRGIYHRTSTLSAGAASLHITIGVETDTDEWTWLALLCDATDALALTGAKSALQAAIWHDERLREALPLQLCRHGTTVRSALNGAAWLAYAGALLSEHGGANPEPVNLAEALDAALFKRQDLVERKRRQLVEFMGLSPLSLEGGADAGMGVGTHMTPKRHSDTQ